MPKRVDANQPAIVKALYQAGATVQHLHEVGRGCPDLLVGYRGVNYLFEIKDSSQPPSKRRLTPNEVEWHAAWRGEVRIIMTAGEALAAIGAV